MITNFLKSIFIVLIIPIQTWAGLSCSKLLQNDINFGISVFFGGEDYVPQRGKFDTIGNPIAEAIISKGQDLDLYHQEPSKVLKFNVPEDQLENFRGVCGPICITNYFNAQREVSSNKPYENLSENIFTDFLNWSVQQKIGDPWKGTTIDDYKGYVRHLVESEILPDIYYLREVKGGEALQRAFKEKTVPILKVRHPEAGGHVVLLLSVDFENNRLLIADPNHESVQDVRFEKIHGNTYIYLSYGERTLLTDSLFIETGPLRTLTFEAESRLER